jgi:hypothetical protein
MGFYSTDNHNFCKIAVHAYVQYFFYFCKLLVIFMQPASDSFKLVKIDFKAVFFKLKQLRIATWYRI